MSDKQMSYDVFLVAREKLEAAGEEFSADKILKLVGSGSKSTPIKHEKKYQEEKRATIRNSFTLSQEFVATAEENFKKELATQTNIICKKLEGSYGETICAFRDCTDTLVETEQERDQLKADKQELQETLAYKDVQYAELATTYREQMAAAEKRTDEATKERYEALRQRDDALREEKHKGDLLQGEARDYARCREDLEAARKELKKVQEEKEKYMMEATSAVTELKSTDSLVADLTARLTEETRKAEENRGLLMAEKEKVARLTAQLEAATEKQNKPQSTPQKSKGSEQSKGSRINYEEEV